MQELIDRITFRFKNEGFVNLIKKGFHKLQNAIIPIRINRSDFYINQFFNKSGLEIGGPSNVFKINGAIPLYSKLKSLDNLDFSSQTIWHDRNSNLFTVNNVVLGKNYILEASNLNTIENNTYDFILSSETLQHMANPILGLFEWNRVIKYGGLLLLILPNPIKTFDHKRKITTFDHLIDDYNRNMQEDDMSHYDEIILKHDLRRDRQAGDLINFSERCKNNMTLRGMHQHVFDQQLAEKALFFTNFELFGIEYHDNNLILFCKKK